MDTATLSRFADELEALGVRCRRATTEALSEAIGDLVDQPAVGVDPPFAPGALADAPVETDFTPEDLAAAATGVTPARFAIASYGTLAIPSTPAGEEAVSLYPSTHVAVVPESEVYPDFDAGFDRLVDAFAAGEDSLVFATGPSATADMGGLVRGAHGPREVRVVVVTET